MKRKYEVADVNNASITVDVSLLTNDDMFFNATEMAKQFSRRPSDFWKQEQNIKYLEVLITLSAGKREDFVFTKKGSKYGGTWLHKKLALQFVRWLDVTFSVYLDEWVVDRLRQESERQQHRLEARTGYLPMTNAVLHAHDQIKFYHFSNEANMINQIIFGMSAAKYREKHEVLNVRDSLDAGQLKEMTRLQAINTGLIEIGMAFQERKVKLTKCHTEGLARQQGLLV